MSQIALFLITNEKTVLDACEGWLAPLDQPRTKKHKNPFTGEVSQVTTLVPEQLDEIEDPSIKQIEAGLEYRVLAALSEAQPICVKFKLQTGIYDILGDSRPFLYGNVHGEIHEIKRVAREDEAALLEFFVEEVGPLVDAMERQKKGLSLFVYIYSF